MSNTYQLMDNPLLTSGGTASESEIKSRAAPIYTRLSAFKSFAPISATAVSDWSLQAGDIIEIDTEDGKKSLPIYTQKIEWNGGAKTVYESTGSEKRPVQSVEIRRQANNDSQFNSLRGGLGGVRQQVSDLNTWATIKVDEANARIDLEAGKIDDVKGRISKAGINIDGDIAQVKLFATEETVDALTGRVSNAESTIELNSDNIKLKVSKDDVISSINLTEESAQIKASKIDLVGYVTASNLSAEIASVKKGFASIVSTVNLIATNSFRFKGNYVTLNSKKVVTSVGLKKELMPIKVNGVTYNPIGGATISYNTDTIYYLGYYSEE